MAQNRHEATREGGLHDLTDDDYFDDLLNHRVAVFDADGNEVTDMYDDVSDVREAKRAGLL